MWCNNNDADDGKEKGYDGHDNDDDVIYNNDDGDDQGKGEMTMNDDDAVIYNNGEQVGGGGPADWPAGVTEGNAGGTPSGIIDLIKETVLQICYCNPPPFTTNELYSISVTKYKQLSSL